jgi:hypothetical protein
MFEFTRRLGEEAIFDRHHIRIVKGGIVPYRHHYRCCLCDYEGVLEFEPDASEPSWTECHDCGFDNEIPPGVYVRPTIIQGYVPCRIR